jgi:hypothetical protein
MHRRPECVFDFQHENDLREELADWHWEGKRVHVWTIHFEQRGQFSTAESRSVYQVTGVVNNFSAHETLAGSG